MGTHTSRLTRSGDLTTAVAVSWAVTAGTGTNPVNAADFPGGVFPSGTATIPANSTYVDVSFTSNPDADPEQNETGLFTVTTTQNGVTIVQSPQPFTITNDDTPTAVAIFPTASTADTGFISAGSVDEWVLTASVDDTNWEIFFGCDDNDGSPGASIKRASNIRITAYNRDATGAEGQNNQMIFQETPVMNGGISLVFKYKRSTGRGSISMNGTVVRTDVPLTAANGGPFLRFRTGGAARPEVTVAAA